MRQLTICLLACLVIAGWPSVDAQFPQLEPHDGTALGAEGIDYATQRNGMHSCPPGAFVTGIHVGRNLLLCSTGFGGYSPGQEKVDDSSQVSGWHPEGDATMHGCPSGAVTGVHGGNILACAPLARGSLFVDKEHQRQGMHACPEGTVLVGFHAARNWLLCGTFREVLSGQEVQRNNMLSCPPGMFVTGLHISKNKLLCSAEYGRWQHEVVDPSTEIRAGATRLRGCPAGMAATGVHNVRRLIGCAPISRSLRTGTRTVQRANMQACPLGAVLVGFEPWKDDYFPGGTVAPLAACGQAL